MVKVKFPKQPANISIRELDDIQAGFKQGETQKEIKQYIDASRVRRGIKQKISTNTISRLSPRSKHHDKMVKDTTHAWNKYEGRKRQHNAWQETRKNITDKDSLKRFDKMMKKIVERSRGERYRLMPKYEAETDEYDVESW